MSVYLLLGFFLRFRGANELPGLFIVPVGHNLLIEINISGHCVDFLLTVIEDDIPGANRAVLILVHLDPIPAKNGRKRACSRERLPVGIVSIPPVCPYIAILGQFIF